jgi:hypothetical protein
MKATAIPSSLILVLAVVSSVSAQTGITISGITGVTHDSILTGGLTHTVTLQYDASGAPAGREYLTSNAWIVYSPDGADWIDVQGEILSSFSALDWDATYLSYFHKTGGTGSFGMHQSVGAGNITGTDSVAVQLAGVNTEPGGGMPAGYSAFTFNIAFSSLATDNGKHICIDYCPEVSGGWEWAHPDGLIEPAWEGPQCWVIGCCSGTVGDANGSGDPDPTIGDITTLISYLFLDGEAPWCLPEADANLSGTTTNPPLDLSDITIGDITKIMDFLFFDLPAMPDCP